MKGAKKQVFKKIKSVFKGIKATVLKAGAVGAAVGTATAAAIVPAFASTAIEDVAITTEQVEVIVDYIVANIAVIMPVGLTVMGIMIGIGVIPRIIKKYTNA